MILNGLLEMFAPMNNERDRVVTMLLPAAVVKHMADDIVRQWNRDQMPETVGHISSQYSDGQLHSIDIPMPWGRLIIARAATQGASKAEFDQATNRYAQQIMGTVPRRRETPLDPIPGYEPNGMHEYWQDPHHPRQHGTCDFSFPDGDYCGLPRERHPAPNVSEELAAQIQEKKS